jgi:hypothetical protein
MTTSMIKGQVKAQRILLAVDRMFRQVFSRVFRPMWMGIPTVVTAAPLREGYSHDAAALRLYHYPRGIRLR